ncbi:RNA-guided endonuclease InsQ/TnpB family protein [Streptomyces sp. NBC_00057]|uniref:RNA-guided endonuclease InsQ/TnpB family protein n=1 Tax=Streptomyces sp. NBC_00057 TaxID=2975634 RepID=UPI003248C560
MIRAYKFLMRPTVRQGQALGEMLRDHCSLYNGALQERRDAYRHVSKTSIKYGMQSAQLKDIRAFDPERQGRWSFSSQQATLRRLDKAFAAFFRRIKAGETPGYPRFRGVNWFDTVEFPKDGDGCRWDSTPHDPVTRVRLQGVGHVKVNQHRPVVGKVKTVGVKREGHKWFVVLTAEQERPEPLPATGSVAGIDLGIANFLADSNGGFVENPRHGRRAAARLEAAQQALSRFPRCRAKDRAANHRRAVEQVAKLHGKVRRQRLDHAHKTALGLVRAHDFIAHEDLRIRNMPAPGIRRGPALTRVTPPRPEGTGLLAMPVGLAGAVEQPHGHRPGGGVPDHVRQGLLHDPVDRGLGVQRQRPGRAHDLEGDLQATAADPFDEAGQRGQ